MTVYRRLRQIRSLVCTRLKSLKRLDAYLLFKFVRTSDKTRVLVARYFISLQTMNTNQLLFIQQIYKLVFILQTGN